MSRYLSITNLKLLAAYVGWWLVWIAIQTIVLTKLNIPWIVAILDASITQATLSLSGYAINTSLRFYQPKQIAKYIFSQSIATSIASACVQWFTLKNVYADNAEYLIFLNQSRIVRLAFDWLMISFITLISWFYFNLLDQRQNEQQKEAAERLAREAELSNLRLQLQPHFLFNSLNSISALVGTSPELARTMIQKLSDFLRGTVGKDDRQLITLEEEIVHLELYLDIEKIRFGHRLKTIVEVDDPSLKSVLPSLLLQPIVENAIKFGLYDTVGDITISINAKIENQYLTIEIKNPFDLTTAHPRKGTGFGLNSIQRRLYLMYSQNDLLNISNDGTIFTTVIKIPQLS